MIFDKTNTRDTINLATYVLSLFVIHNSCIEMTKYNFTTVMARYQNSITK
jgi:hypothetical protein